MCPWRAQYEIYKTLLLHYAKIIGYIFNLNFVLFPRFQFVSAHFTKPILIDHTFFVRDRP